MNSTQWTGLVMLVEEGEQEKNKPLPFVHAGLWLLAWN